MLNIVLFTNVIQEYFINFTIYVAWKTCATKFKEVYFQGAIEKKINNFEKKTNIIISSTFKYAWN